MGVMLCWVNDALIVRLSLGRGCEVFPGFCKILLLSVGIGLKI